MKSVGPEAVRDLLLLSVVAGSADAAGYLGLGRVFTSNMTGNVVLLGIDLGQGEFAAAGRSGFVLAIYMLGAAIGAWLGQGIDQKDWPQLASRLITLEKIALLIFAAGWILEEQNPAYIYALLIPLTLAMGLQSAAMNRLSAPGASTTAITGTITSLIAGLVLLLNDRDTSDKQRSTGRIQFQFGIIALYGVGAVGSGVLMLYAPRLAGCLPALFALFVSRRGSERSSPSA